MFNKKLAVFALALSAMGMVSCGGGDSADLTYWCPNTDNALMKSLVDDFKAANPDYAGKNIKLLANMGEGDTYAALHKDLKRAADVICMADNSIRSAVAGGDLAPIDDKAFEATVSKGAVQATSIDNQMYGYAYRADNSPMPMYDNTVLTKDDCLSLETILKKSKDAGKKVYLSVNNGWYNPYFIWAGGGSISITASGKQGADWGGQGAAKQGVVESITYFKNLFNEYKDTWVSSDDSAMIEAGFKAKTISYCVLWNDLVTIQSGNPNVHATTWPSVKIGDGVVKLHCFSSYKAIVCKQNKEDPERLAFAKTFAKFLASKDAQMKRFDTLKYGPSNLELLADEKIKSNEFIASIGVMEAEGRTHGQAISVTEDFWTPMANLGNLIINKTDGWGTYSSAGRALDGVTSNTGWEIVK